MKKDTYKTIEFPSEETLFKEKNSKFFGYVFPVFSEDDVKNALAIFAVNFPPFDGEPNNSVGMPIHEQI